MVLVMGAAIVRDGRVLAARRARPEGLAGGWEFPGGKAEPGETPEAAVVREIAEELGCTVEVTGHLTGEVTIREGYVLRVAVASLIEGEPVPREDEHDAVRWLGPEDLDELTWLEPDVPFLEELREVLLDGAPLEGGNVGVTVRIGHTVRRATGPWTPAVHALLDHLEDKGLPAVPRVLGTDRRDREILTFLTGTIVDVDHDLLNEAQLVSIVEWTRDLHDATEGFDHPGPWRFPPVEHPEIVAHNDIAPYNVCFTGDRVSGVFDWDLAAPSTRLMDLGVLVWTCVPLFRDLDPATVARRVELIARAYSRYTVRELLDAAEARARRSSDVVRTWIETGAPGAEGMVAVGEPARTEAGLADWAVRRPAIEKELR